MSIFWQVDKTEYEKDPTNITVLPQGSFGSDKEIYRKETHQGLVIGLDERNMYNDSDFYAVVYNTDQDKFEKIEYGTTRFWTYANSARVDATPEIQEKYKEHLKTLNKRAVIRQRIKEIADCRRHGVQVRVIRGRKVAIGTEGEVFWSGLNKYNWRADKEGDYNVGVRTLYGTTFFTSIKNVERIYNSEENTWLEQNRKLLGE